MENAEETVAMNAEIVATGEEIRTGALIDSNSAHIADRLEENGVAVSRHICVGDDLDLLIAAFKEIGGRADIAVVTGGLGPTSDDLTSEAAARAVDRAMPPWPIHAARPMHRGTCSRNDMAPMRTGVTVSCRA